MKKVFISILWVCLVQLNSSAQKIKSYSTSAGLIFESGNSHSNLAGASAKHFLDEHNGIIAECLLGEKRVLVGFGYQYQQQINAIKSLKWHIGIVYSNMFSKSFVSDEFGDFVSRGNAINASIGPLAGLDYSLMHSRIHFNIDWRPAFQLKHKVGFEYSWLRFGIYYYL
ncbi:MAG TPA: hypothetical protein VGO09_05275 [Flavisolibacter sp.]|nr:hypothetical protein [Flavisolibacter sp.]